MIWTKRFLLVLVAASLLAIPMTVYDKWAAKHRPDRRVPEDILLFLGFIGGSFFMWLTMQIIRHKTKHLKFMVLLPFFWVLHFVLLGFLLYKEGYLFWLPLIFS